MKIKTILIAISLLTTIVCNAQKSSKSELPTKGKEFIKEHFPNETIISVTEDSKDSKKGFKAVLSDKTEVEFWKNGNWREVDGKGKAIPTVFVVNNALEYVAKNYPSQKITKVEYSQSKIEVKLTNNTELEFDINGKFIK